VDVGTNVRIPIDPVDRPKLGHHNLLGVVLEVKEGLYKIGTSNGVLPQSFARNQLEPCENHFLLMNDVPSKETTFRAAVGADSVTGTQGNF
jgi:hypothetical protein